MTPSSSAPSHRDEWLRDYLARQQAAINRRPKPEGMDDSQDEALVIIHNIPE
jgi:hypothetical protein